MEEGSREQYPESIPKVRLLLEAGVNRAGALLAAVRAGHLEVVAELARAHGDVNEALGVCPWGAV